MDAPPPRRRRGSTPRTALPLVPILIGLIVVGFAIGAALSLLERKQPESVAVGSPTAAPTPLAPVTLAPQATAAPIEPTTVPIPSPEAKPSIRPSPHRRATPAARPVSPVPVQPTIAPMPRPSPVARVTNPPTKPPVVAALPRPLPSPRVAAPAIAPSAIASQMPQSTPLPEATDQYDSDFARLSAGVVRAYLRALQRGDDDSAYASLGATPGSAGASLTEKQFAVPGMRITRLNAQGHGDSAQVDVDVDSPSGTYFAQFFLRRTPSGAAIIYNKSFIKV